MLWSGSTRVVQKVPMILHKPSFWVIARCLRSPCCLTLVYHTGAPYVRMGMIKVLYTLHQFRKSNPLMELLSRFMALIVERAWVTMILTCLSHLRHLLMYKPRYWSVETLVMWSPWLCLYQRLVIFGPCLYGLCLWG